MKITFEHYDYKSAHEMPDDTSIDVLLSVFRGTLVAAGFSQYNVDEYFPANPDEKIIVEIRGGVAHCNDPRVKIRDYD